VTQSLADSFRVIEPQRLLFGVNAAGEPHLLSLMAARIATLTNLAPNRIFKSFAEEECLGPYTRADGVLVASVALPECEDTVWTAARLSTPIRQTGRRAIDLAFAVAGSPRSLTARRALETFYRLSTDSRSLGHIRKANSPSWFRAELTIAFERLDHRETDKMTG
jgi:hypothetical protein